MASSDLKEKSVEDHLVAQVEKRGGMCPKMEVKGSRGWPDRLVILPGGVVAFIEVKRPKGGVVSRLQKEKLKELTALGHIALVVKTNWEVDRVLEMLDLKVAAQSLLSARMEADFWRENT